MQISIEIAALKYVYCVLALTFGRYTGLNSYSKNFLMYLCCSILRRTQSPAKFTC